MILKTLYAVLILLQLHSSLGQGNDRFRELVVYFETIFYLKSAFRNIHNFGDSFFNCYSLNPAFICLSRLALSTITVESLLISHKLFFKTFFFHLILGIASSPLGQNLCAANDFAKLSCPDKYIIAFRKKFYGVSDFNACFPLLPDCTENIAGDEDECAGADSCTINYTAKVLSGCDYKLSSYLRIEYECIPSNNSNLIEILKICLFERAFFRSKS